MNSSTEMYQTHNDPHEDELRQRNVIIDCADSRDSTPIRKIDIELFIYTVVFILERCSICTSNTQLR